MTTDPIPIIELNQTDSRKRGQLYGEAARERIHAILNKYREIFQRITGETWEKTVEEHVLWPQNGFFVHTNHYLKQGKNFRDLKPLRDPYLSTYLRCRRAQKGMAALKGSIDVRGILKILSNHMDRPFSVCAHENPAQAPLQQVVTCLSIIMNLARKQIRYTLGNPCRGESRTLELDSFLS